MKSKREYQCKQGGRVHTSRKIPVGWIVVEGRKYLCLMCQPLRGVCK